MLEKYYKEQQEGRRFVVFAKVDGKAVGYATLLSCNPHGPEALRSLPVVNDFNVLEGYQHHGIGNSILDRIEAQAATMSDEIALGVGMHPGYGSAQRLYVKRGYVPDGSGVWYRDVLLPMNGACCNDDDLVLYLSKKLK